MSIEIVSTETRQSAIGLDFRACPTTLSKRRLEYTPATTPFVEVDTRGEKPNNRQS